MASKMWHINRENMIHPSKSETFNYTTKVHLYTGKLTCSFNCKKDPLINTGKFFELLLFHLVYLGFLDVTIYPAS